MRYGFVIDQDRCIGCHACTVACKEEHESRRSFRTWVKYIEKGEFPDTSAPFRRHAMQPLRRCAVHRNLPDRRALPPPRRHRRFRHERCIGCKSCMQACPYDALYIDPKITPPPNATIARIASSWNSNRRASSSARRRRIISGDLDDCAQRDRQHRRHAEDQRPQATQGHRAKTFLCRHRGRPSPPTRMAQQAAHIWAEKPPGANADVYASSIHVRARALAPAHAREVYECASRAWGWLIAAYYLSTKSIAAELLFVAAIPVGSSGIDPRTAGLATHSHPSAALIVSRAYHAIAVDRLKQPLGSFYFILQSLTWRSWAG